MGIFSGCFLSHILCGLAKFAPEVLVLEVSPVVDVIVHFGELVKLLFGWTEVVWVSVAAAHLAFVYQILVDSGHFMDSNAFLLLSYSDVGCQSECVRALILDL